MITRDQKVEQSVQEYLRTQLYDVLDYSEADVELLDDFEYGRFDSALDKSYVTLGFNFDDGGRAAECGSSLIHRVITIELFIFGLDMDWGKNLTGIVKHCLHRDQVIPLLDIGVSDNPPIIDYLELPPIGAVRGERVPVRDPRPWEENLYRVVVKVEDEYYTALEV